MRKTSYLTVTDQFCGAGGSSIGAKKAGAEVSLALNHWEIAIATHSANFPDTDHDIADMSGTDPRRYRRTDILITSPECTNHSLSKGVKRQSRQSNMFDKGIVDPAAERSRATMWDVPRFAEHHQYESIIVENVPDARHWVMWDAWIMAMKLLGYEHEAVYLNSMFFHPTPQSRDRLYVIFWRKGNKRPNLAFNPMARCQPCQKDVAAVQSWKNPLKQWGKYKQQYLYRCPVCAGVVEPYYYCAWNVIDWSIKAQRIGDRKKPLKEKTMARIRHGINKFGKQHLLVRNYSPGYSKPLTDPTGSITTSDHHALLSMPLLVPAGYTHEEHDRRSYPVSAPLPTQSTRQEMGLAVPFVASYYGTDKGHELTDPLGTITTKDRHAVVVPPWLIGLGGIGRDRDLDLNNPMTTITGTPTYGMVVPPFLTSPNHSDLRVHDITEPLPTQTASWNHGVVTPPFLASVNYFKPNVGMDQPAPTQTTGEHYGGVTTPFLASYYGGRHAVQALDQALPTVPGMAVHYIAEPTTPEVEDCGFRMLQPHEIGRGMAFPSDYKVTGDKRQQIKQYGNAVTPPVMEWLFARVAETLK